MTLKNQPRGSLKPRQQSRDRKNPEEKKRRDAVNGMLLIDKPQGLSSNQAMQKVKRLLNAQKSGHTGSLDPIATGLLPLCFGHATRISGMFLESDKCYEVKIRLGINTTSGDRAGEIVSQAAVDVSLAQLESVAAAFRGRTKQIPPMFCALKRNGQPLYKLARQGIEVEREPRLVTVHDLSITDFQADTVDLRVRCSKGFYIRSLVMDMGEALGCGGHVEQLRRTAAGPFTINQALTVDQLAVLESPAARQTLLLPVDQVLAHLPKIDLPEKSAQYFCHGQPVRALNLPGPGLARLYGEENNFLGLGEVRADGRVAPKRLFV